MFKQVTVSIETSNPNDVNECSCIAFSEAGFLNRLSAAYTKALLKNPKNVVFANMKIAFDELKQ